MKEKWRERERGERWKGNKGREICKKEKRVKDRETERGRER